MLEIDSTEILEAPSPPAATRKRRASRRAARLAEARILPEIQPFPSWARLRTPLVDGSNAAADAAFAAGVSLARLDQVLRCGQSGETGVAEPVYAGALRQRLALRAGAAFAALARLREDEAGLRDGAHLAGFDAAPTPGGRLHRLWRLFAIRPMRLNARIMRMAADHLDLPPDIDGDGLIAVAHEAMGETPLVTAARVSAETLRVLNNVSPIDAEIFALWLADLILAQKLRWDAPLPLLATTIAHPSLRNALGRRPRPSDPDWSLSVTRAYARATQEAYALVGELSRRSQTLLRAAPKLRAKGAARVIEMLLDDDCVAPARAAKIARLSDRASRRLFDRLMELGAVRELSGRTNFRLYGL